jgi:hypothetical protein
MHDTLPALSCLCHVGGGCIKEIVTRSPYQTCPGCGQPMWGFQLCRPCRHKRECEVHGCGQPAFSNGLCSRHYQHHRQARMPACTIKACTKPQVQPDSAARITSNIAVNASVCYKCSAPHLFGRGAEHEVSRASVPILPHHVVSAPKPPRYWEGSALPGESAVNRPLR